MEENLLGEQECLNHAYKCNCIYVFLYLTGLCEYDDDLEIQNKCFKQFLFPSCFVESVEV